VVANISGLGLAQGAAVDCNQHVAGCVHIVCCKHPVCHAFESLGQIALSFVIDTSMGHHN
jgi:hypothetical protein